jgi:hypothetical protein
VPSAPWRDYDADESDLARALELSAAEAWRAAASTPRGACAGPARAVARALASSAAEPISIGMDSDDDGDGDDDEGLARAISLSQAEAQEDEEEWRRESEPEDDLAQAIAMSLQAAGAGAQAGADPGHGSEDEEAAELQLLIDTRERVTDRAPRALLELLERQLDGAKEANVGLAGLAGAAVARRALGLGDYLWLLPGGVVADVLVERKQVRGRATHHHRSTTLHTVTTPPQPHTVTTPPHPHPAPSHRLGSNPRSATWSGGRRRRGAARTSSSSGGCAASARGRPSCSLRGMRASPAPRPPTAAWGRTTRPWTRRRRCWS